MTATPQSIARERVKWIDALRGFIMLLMVFGHVWAGLHRAQLLKSEWIFTAVYNWIYFFHMPALFVISGMFFSGSGGKQNFAQSNGQRVLRFLYPLVLWSYVYFLTKYAFESDVNRPVSVTDVVLAPFPPKDHFWFIWALFVIQLAASALFVLMDRLPGGHHRVMRGMSGLGLALLATLAPGNQNPWIAASVWMAPFFFLGVLLYKFPRQEFSGAAALVSGFLLFLIPPTAAVMFGTNVASIVIYAAQAVCILGLMLVAMGLGHHFARARMTDLLVRIGQASMTIYLLHIFFTSGVRIILSRLKVDDLTIHLAAGLIAGLVLPLAIHSLLGRSRMRAWLGL